MAGTASSLTVQRVGVRGVSVPIRYVLGTSAASVTAVPLVLVSLQMSDGVVGHSYVFCYTASGAKAVAGHVTEAVELIAGRRLDPIELAGDLAKRYRLLGVTGTVRMALSALDCALWDAAASEAGLPLARYLGGECRPIQAYDSRGLGLMPAAELARETEALLERGLKAIKLRLGYPTLEEDLAALRAVRSIAPGDVEVMVDYNQALTVDDAIERGAALQAEPLVWLEEPIRHDDYRGAAEIARALDVPVQIGENFGGPFEMRRAVEAGASDLVMLDVARIGGVTGWMECAELANAAALKLSSHLMPELSIHLLAASPTAHYVEWVDWAEGLLVEPLRIDAGFITPPDRPGLGLCWDESKLARLDRL